MNNNLLPLSKTNYVRPEEGTYQDSIQNKKDMLEKLNDYENTSTSIKQFTDVMDKYMYEHELENKKLCISKKV